MSAVASGLSFEVLRFTVEPVSAEVALLELEGRFRAETRRRLGVPRLMAESDEGSREVAPAAANEAQAEPDGGLWRASYAVALEILDDGSFALAVGRELLVGLPAPDLAETSGEREVRLAREANALRRTADEARAAAAAALASAGTERQARETTEAEMAEARMARDDHARRASSLDDDLAQLRREHAAELVRRDEEQAAALAGRDEEAAQAAEERVAELEAEAAEARRSLRAARAEAEAMRRDLERERERAEAAEAAVRRGRVTELDGEPVQVDDAGDADDLEPATAVVVPDGARPSPPRAPRPTRTRPTSSIPRQASRRPRSPNGPAAARPATTAARTPPRSPPASAPSPSRATPARPSASSARGARGAPARARPPRPPPAPRPSAPVTSSPVRRRGAARPPPGWRACWPSRRWSSWSSRCCWSSSPSERPSPGFVCTRLRRCAARHRGRGSRARGRSPTRPRHATTSVRRRFPHPNSKQFPSERPRGTAAIRQAYFGSRGAMILYALSPRPRRSRSSESIGSRPVSSFTRSRR